MNIINIIMWSDLAAMVASCIWLVKDFMKHIKEETLIEHEPNRNKRAILERIDGQLIAKLIAPFVCTIITVVIFCILVAMFRMKSC